MGDGADGGEGGGRRGPLSTRFEGLEKVDRDRRRARAARAKREMLKKSLVSDCWLRYGRCTCVSRVPLGHDIEPFESQRRYSDAN